MAATAMQSRGNGTNRDLFFEMLPHSSINAVNCKNYRFVLPAKQTQTLLGLLPAKQTPNLDPCCIEWLLVFKCHFR
jgi:hypothetical protein